MVSWNETYGKLYEEFYFKPNIREYASQMLNLADFYQHYRYITAFPANPFAVPNNDDFLTLSNWCKENSIRTFICKAMPKNEKWEQNGFGPSMIFLGTNDIDIHTLVLLRWG